MNRGVMVTRGKPDEEELILSAKFVAMHVQLSFLLSSFNTVLEMIQPIGHFLTNFSIWLTKMDQISLKQQYNSR